MSTPRSHTHKRRATESVFVRTGHADFDPIPPPPVVLRAPGQDDIPPPPLADYVPPPPLPSPADVIPPPPLPEDDFVPPPPPAPEDELGPPPAPYDEVGPPPAAYDEVGPPPSEGTDDEPGLPVKTGVDARTDAFMADVGPLLHDMAEAVNGFDVAKHEALKAAIQAAKDRLARAVDAFFAPESAVLERERRARERLKHRQNLIDELSATEGDYVRDLQLMERIWHAEVRRSGLMSPADTQVLFGNVNQLLVLSLEISEKLTTAKSQPVECQMIGDEFKKKIPFMRLYIEYCSNQLKGTEILASAMKNSKFREFVDKLQATNSALKNLDLASYLIKPTQRITKYPLFLRDLVKSTDKNHPDYNNIIDASEAMHKVLTEINKRTRERETIAAINKMLPHIMWRYDTHVDLVLSLSQLLMEGKISSTVVDPHDPSLEKGNTLFLFNNVLLVFRHTKDHWQEITCVPTQNMIMKEPSKELPGSVTIICSTKPEEVILHFQTNQERKSWIHGVEEAIKNAGNAPQVQYAEATAKTKKSERRERADSDVDARSKALKSKTLRNERAGSAEFRPNSPVNAPAISLLKSSNSPLLDSPQDAGALMVPVGRKRTTSEADLMGPPILQAPPPALIRPPLVQPAPVVAGSSVPRLPLSGPNSPKSLGRTASNTPPPCVILPPTVEPPRP